eukprot:evm.model.scf_2676.2 EVM.evm.TU.scf_2676.2   scf_2676:8649-10735(+)
MASHRPQACWEPPYRFYAETPPREGGPPCLISPSYSYRIPECAKEDDPREFQSPWRPPPPPPAFPLHVQRPDWREEFHWRSRAYLPVGGAFYHQGGLPPAGAGAYDGMVGDEHHHGVRGRAEPVMLDAEAARRWAKPRRRVRSIDQGEDYRAFRAQPRHYVEVYKATHRDPYLFASEEDVGGRGEVPMSGQRRLAGPIRELVAARQPMLSEKLEAVEEGRRPEVARGGEGRRGSPREEKGGKARGGGGRERAASPDEAQELSRLQKIAEEYAKMKEENEKLQEDLNKSKRLNKNLRKENRRLFRKQNSAAAAEQQKQEAEADAEAEAVPVPPPLTPSEGDDVLQQHVIQQLQSLQMEKAKLLQENCQLTRDNESLQELLHYAVGEQGSGSEGGSGSDSDSEDENQEDYALYRKGLKEHAADQTGTPPVLCDQNSGIPF